MKPSEFWEKIKNEPHVHLIFLCGGNICRSPFAEMKFKQLLERSTIKNKSKFLIQSGGFIQQNFPIHEFTKQALLDEKVEEATVDQFQSRPMRKHKDDMRSATALIVMSKSTRDVLVPMKYREKTLMLSEIALDEQEVDISDPALIHDYDKYLETMNQIKEYLEKVIVKMEKNGF
jgi:protein-tyrosine-phosphatase